MAIERVSEWLGGSSSIIMSEVQRNYVWDAGQACDLLNEIRGGEAFLGGVSFIRDNDYSFRISDGCQRLTTILLINKIYEASPAAFLQIQSNAIQLKYVSAFDTDQINKIMKTDFSNVNTIEELKEKCYREGLDRRSNITKNFIALYSLYLDDKKDPLHVRSTKKHLLQSRLYGMEIPKGCDEVDVFLNLNSKGTAITLEDMIKAYYPDDPSADEKTYIKFNNLRKHFNEKYSEVEFRRFLRRVHNYRTNTLWSRKAEELKFYEDEVKTFALLKANADMYENIRDRKYNEHWIKKNWPVLCSSFMFGIYESNLTDTDKEAILDFICKWLYKNIPYINTLQSNNNSFQLKEGNVFGSLLKKLKVTNSISLAEVKTALNDFNKNVTDWTQKTKEGLNYKLSGGKYIFSVFDDLGYVKNEMKDWTVEHIWAQNCETGRTDDEHTHKLGNLTLLGRKMNSSAGKSNPVKKFACEAYKNSGFGPTTDLMGKLQWTEKDIDERHERLANEWIAF